jgi:UDP-N-acetylmuramyl pentapeptide phosphotransferase/UDP-N-acetylglucosamine-1-phosphate transferase
MSKKGESYIPWTQRVKNVVLVIVSGLAGGLVGVAMALSMFVVSSKKIFLDAAEKHGISEKNSSRLGGPFIFLGAIVLGWVHFMTQGSSCVSNQDCFLEYFPAYLGVALLCGILGLWEDYTQRLSARFRLQILFLIVGAYFLLNSSALPTDILPTSLQWLNHPFVVGVVMTICVVGFINAGNMADGANGLLSTIALAVFLIGYLETGSSALMAVLVSTFVFSLFNVMTGSMFLGDSGAYFLSALMALVCVDLYMQGNSSVWFHGYLLSYPCVELIRVLYVRWKRGGSLLAADNNHLHNRLFEKLKSSGFSPLLGNTCTGLSLAILSTFIPLTGYLLDLAPLDSSVWLWVFCSYCVAHLLLAQYLDSSGKS